MDVLGFQHPAADLFQCLRALAASRRYVSCETFNTESKQPSPDSTLEILIRPCPTLCSHFSVLLPGRLFPFSSLNAVFLLFFSQFQFFRLFFFFSVPPDRKSTPPSNCISFLSSPPLLLSSPCLPLFAESSQCSQPYRLAFLVFGFFLVFPGTNCF